MCVTLAAELGSIKFTQVMPVLKALRGNEMHQKLVLQYARIGHWKHAYSLAAQSPGLKGSQKESRSSTTKRALKVL